jgi:hypothetical protein
VTHRCHNREFLVLKFARDRNEYRAKLLEHLGRREPCWTEGLAVGSVGFVERFKPADFSRRQTELVETATDVWALQETTIPYRQKTRPENAAKGLQRGGFGSSHL